MGSPDSLKLRMDSPAAPAVAVSKIQTLIDDDACAASGAYTYPTNGVIDVAEARRITFFVDYNPADADGRPAFLPLVSCEDAKPGQTDDSWFEMSVWDGAITGGVLNGDVPTGADYTVAPDRGRALHRGLVIILEPADAGADEIRVSFTLDVTPYRWLQLAYAEDGDEANPGTLTVKYTTSV